MASYIGHIIYVNAEFYSWQYKKIHSILQNLQSILCPLKTN